MKSLEATLRDLVAEELGVDPTDVLADSRFDALGADSLERLELAMRVEEECGITIPDADVDRLQTFSQLCAYVVEALEQKAKASA